MNVNFQPSLRPYPGLRPFKREETDIFFGREEHTDQLLKQLSHTRFISVIGTSGCGKSSLVRAGMIAALKNGYLPNAGTHWRVASMRPGDTPLKNLARVLLSGSALGPERINSPGKEQQAKSEVLPFLTASLRRGPLGLVEIFQETPLPERTNLLLLVDQFEEIFRFHRKGGRDEIEAFVSLLLTSAKQRDVPIYVVTTMRSDFVGDCALFHDLPEMMNAGQFLVPRLTRDQQKMAIIGPAGVFGTTIEPRLVNRLLNEMGTDPDQLPLLQHCLMRMWLRANERKGKAEEKTESRFSGSPRANGVTINLEDYEAVGGLKEALSRHADEAYNELNEIQQKIAESLFRCLSERSLDQLDMRRPSEISQIGAVAGASVQEVIEVIEKFRHPDRCFLTPAADVVLEGDSVVDISHESLIRQWHRMNTWVDREMESAETYHHLEQTARLWKQDKAALWGTPDLELALKWKEDEKPTAEWAARYGQDFKTAMKFLDVSKQAQEEQRLKEDRARQKELENIHIRLQRKMLAIIGILLAIALSLMGWLWYTTKQQATLIRTGQLALQAEAALEQSPRLSLLLAIEALRLTLPEAEPEVAQMAEEALHQAMHHLATYGLPHNGAVWSVAFSSDSRWLSTGSADGTVRLWDLHAEVPNLAPIVLSDHMRPVSCVVISPDNHWLVTGSQDGTVRLWDLNEAPSLTDFIVLNGHQGAIYSATISADSQWLVTAGDDSTVWVWNLQASNPAEVSFPLERHKSPMWIVALSPDSRWLATRDGYGIVRLWELGTLNQRVQPIMQSGQEEKMKTVTFSPDSRWLAAGSQEGAIHLWELAALEPGTIPIILTGHTDEIRSMAFSPDTQWLVTGSKDSTARLWNLQAGVPTGNAIILRGHEGSLTVLKISSDSRWLVTGSQDTTARLWDLQAADHEFSFRVLGEHRGPVYGVDISPDNRWLITRSMEGKSLKWNLQAADPAATPTILPGQQEYVWRAAISPDSRWFVTGSQGGMAHIWDLNTEIPSKIPNEPDKMIELACQIVGRNLRRDEWEDYFFREKYRRTCPEYPVHQSTLKKDGSQENFDN